MKHSTIERIDLSNDDLQEAIKEWLFNRSELVPGGVRVHFTEQNSNLEVCAYLTWDITPDEATS